MKTLTNYMRTPATDNLRSKSIFELSDEELRERLRPTAEQVTQEIWAKNGYITYYDPAICPDTLHMIHEYRDRKELVRIDPSGTVHLVKIL
ncbi:hypothetical protein KHS38_14600 [Mucilaginibacter sp. Bleaf8]|uniref:hypothetical protein n=1 Tax=Mucilaginibacter sp. Bleaf8 TaxID=2834430 RepID=UPI001BCAE9DC|nr:hypothetical protein [Mucilaginibacter sp. Bleaf8]MBS7565638.1 hypothetical protein [Mucilaginibacter sp. Bleaf8]